MFPISSDTRIDVSVAQLWRGALLVAALVLAVAAVLPNVLPKTWTIATQDFVEDGDRTVSKTAGAELDDQKKRTDALEAKVDDVAAIVVKVETVQIDARASQEADRVTRHIRNRDRALEEYRRIYDAARRNLAAKEPREPLEGVALP